MHIMHQKDKFCMDFFNRKQVIIMLERIPQVFISYSWTSEAFQHQVKELAEKLIHDGVRVK